MTESQRDLHAQDKEDSLSKLCTASWQGPQTPQSKVAVCSCIEVVICKSLGDVCCHLGLSLTCVEEAVSKANRESDCFFLTFTSCFNDFDGA